MSTTKFWAGGSRDGWFVKMSREQEVYPGHKPADVTVRFFWSRDYPNHETGAAHAANALADGLNAALLDHQRAVEEFKAIEELLP